MKPDRDIVILSKQTRPDMWITNTLSGFMNEPTTDHWSAGKRVLRYLKYSNNFELFFPRDNDSKQTENQLQIGYYFQVGN